MPSLTSCCVTGIHDYPTRKRNTKNSQGDYVRRAWECVIAHSAAKDLNWLGRPDKRVNNGLGKRGIKESIITKAILSILYS